MKKKKMEKKGEKETKRDGRKSENLMVSCTTTNLSKVVMQY